MFSCQSIKGLNADSSEFQLRKCAGEMWQKYGNLSVSQQSDTLLGYSREKPNSLDY